MDIPTKLPTKRHLLKEACVIARDRIRAAGKKGMTAFEFASSLRRLEVTRWECSLRNGATPKSLLLFPFGARTKVFGQEEFAELHNIVDLPFERIALALSLEDIPMPMSFRVFYEVYHELLAEHPGIAG